PEAAIELLSSTTQPLTAGGFARATGNGRLDAGAALQSATVDSDGDGVYDVVDNCPTQSYPTTDGCFVAPPPTPTPTPWPTVSPTPTPTPTPHPDPVPRLRSVTATVTRCKPHRTCKRSATVKLTPDRNARVSVRVDLQV